MKEISDEITLIINLLRNSEYNWDNDELNELYDFLINYQRANEKGRLLKFPIK